MKKDRKKELMRLAHVISNLYQSELNKLPYGANVIDELHAGENAHSRILRMLLQYSCSGTFPVYKSFISLIKKRSNSNVIPNDIDCYHPTFVNEEGRIDLLIKDSCPKDSCLKKFAIIIENKICGATDQDKQIQRYIEKAEGDNVDTNRIFVIYLTKDGTKEASDYSLTVEAKKKLGITEDSTGRFIRLDYMNHILPWLQNDVYPTIPIKEDILISSIRLYIDYLNGIFGKRDGEKQIFKNIILKMKEELNIKTLEECVNLYNDVNILNEHVSNMMIKEASEILERCFYKPLEECLKEHKIEFKFEEKGNDAIHFWFDIQIIKWEKTKIRFTYDSSGSHYGICHKDINIAKVDDGVIERIKASFPTGKSATWWPWYKMLKSITDSSDSPNIWLTVNDGSLVNIIKEWLVKVMQETESLEM